MPRPATAILLSLGAGLVAGLMFASMASGGRLSMLLGCLLPLPLFMAGLALGLPAAGIAAVAGALVGFGFGGAYAGLWFALVVGLPVTVLCRQALLSRDTPSAVGELVGAPGAVVTEWYPPGALLAWATGLCVALLSLLFLWFAAEDGGLKGVLGRQADRVVDAIVQQAPSMVPAGGEEQFRLRARFFAELAPASMAVLWMAMMLTNGAVAQWGVTRMGRNLRPTPAYAEARLPVGFAVALALSLLLAMLSGGFGYYGATLAAALAVPYVVIGLAAMHVMTRGRPSRVPVLVLTYLCLITFTFPLVLLGLADQLFDLRGRYGPRTTT
jgi:hypothetical protein